MQVRLSHNRYAGASHSEQIGRCVSRRNLDASTEHNPYLLVLHTQNRYVGESDSLHAYMQVRRAHRAVSLMRLSHNRHESNLSWPTMVSVIFLPEVKKVLIKI